MKRMSGMAVMCAALAAGVVRAQSTIDWMALGLEEGGGGQSRVNGLTVDPRNRDTVYIGQSLDAGGTWRAAVWTWDEQHNPALPAPVIVLPDSAHGDSSANAAVSRRDPMLAFCVVGSTTNTQGAAIPCIWTSTDGVQYAQTLLSTPLQGAAQAIGGPEDERLGTLVGGYVVEGSAKNAAAWELVSLPNTWQRTDLPAPLAGPSEVTAASETRLGGWVTMPGGTRRAAFWERDTQGEWQVSAPMLTQPLNFDASSVVAIHDIHMNQGNASALVVWTSSTLAGEIGAVVTERVGMLWESPVTGPDGTAAFAFSGMTDATIPDTYSIMLGSVADAQSVPLPAWARSTQFPALEMNPIVPFTALPEFDASAAIGGATLESGAIAIACTGVYPNGQEHGFLLVGKPRLPCDPCDANCDGVVDAFDIDPFIMCLIGP